MIPPVAPNSIPYKISEPSNWEPRYILARLGNNHGPVIASTRVQGIQFAVPPDTSLKRVGSYADGSQAIEGTYVLSPALPGLDVTFSLVRSGVAFSDGTINKTLNANQFDELGIAKQNFIRAAGVDGSVCTEIRAFYNGVLVVYK